MNEALRILLGLAMPMDKADDGTGGGGGGGSGSGGDGGEGGDDPNKPKPTDAEAKLLREVMEKKDKLKNAEGELAKLREQMKAFDGIDPAKFKELSEAAEKAEADRKKREEDELRAQQRWEDLLARKEAEGKGVVEQITAAHSKELTELRRQLREAQEANSKTAAEKDELLVSNAFGGSKFIVDKTNLSTAKARKLFGDHFDLKDGAVVAYDKPRADPTRAPLVDGQGNALSFDAAIEKLVEADPDRDMLLRSSMKPGAGSGSDKGTKATTTDPGTGSAGLSKIAAGLAAARGAKK